MELHKQIIRAVETEKDEINRLKHGEVVIVVQDSKAIRVEGQWKKKIEKQG